MQKEKMQKEKMQKCRNVEIECRNAKKFWKYISINIDKKFTSFDNIVNKEKKLKNGLNLTRIFSTKIWKMAKMHDHMNFTILQL
jgi:hypothetical protein